MRKAKDTDQEEVEDISFVPSAISVPRKPMFRCDMLWSAKTLSFWQLASVVIKEGFGITHYQLVPEMLQRVPEGQRKTTLTNWQWREFAAQEGAPWKALNNIYDKCGNISAKEEQE